MPRQQWTFNSLDVHDDLENKHNIVCLYRVETLYSLYNVKKIPCGCFLRLGFSAHVLVPIGRVFSVHCELCCSIAHHNGVL